MNQRLKSSCVVAVVFMLYGCNIADLKVDKIAPLQLSPENTLNLGSATYTVSELIEDIEDETIDVVTGEDMSITLMFSESNVFNGDEALIELESVYNQALYEPEISTPIVPFAYDVDFEEEYKFTFAAVDDKDLDSIYYSDGKLNYLLESDFEAGLDYAWEIVGTQDRETNQNLSGTSSLPYSGTQITDGFSRDLLGTKSIMNKNADGENEFIVRISGTLHFEAGAQIRISDKLKFNLEYEDPGFSEIFGFFGSEEVEVQKQTIDLDSFEEFAGDGIKLGDPSIRIETLSSFGMDMGLDFSDLTAITSDGSTLSLIETMTEREKTILGTDNLDSGQESVITLDRTNSNIDELLNSLPSQLDFSLTALSNPPSSTLATNFVSTSSEIAVDVTVAIPLNIQFDGFSTDFNFEIEGLEDLEQIDQFEIQIFTTNEIPFEGNIHLEFLDDNDQEIHKILNAATIDTPTVGANGRVTEPKVSTSSLIFDDAGMQALLDAKKIRGVIEVSTFDSENGTYVDIYADYTLEMELIAIVQALIEVEL